MNTSPSRPKHNNLQVLNSLLTNYRKHSFLLPPKKTNVIVLFSGGMDSVSLISLLLSKYTYNVYPIHVEGANNSPQKKSVLFFDQYFQDNYSSQYTKTKIVKQQNLFTFNNITNSSITKDQHLVAQNLTLNPIDSSIMTTLPANPTRLFQYARYAYEYSLYLRMHNNIEAHTAFCGVVRNDSIVNESRLETFRAINFALCTLLHDYRFQFTAPIDHDANFYYTKAQLAKRAIGYDVPLDRSYSCGQHNTLHCGTCYDCLMRQSVFKELKANDKTHYQTNTFRARIVQKLASYLNRKNTTTQNIKVQNVDMDARYLVKDYKKINNKSLGAIVFVPDASNYLLLKTKKDQKLFLSIAKLRKFTPTSLAKTKTIKNSNISPKHIRSFVSIGVSVGLFSLEK